jgi:hypothetical protein
MGLALANIDIACDFDCSFLIEPIRFKEIVQHGLHPEFEDCKVTADCHSITI